MPDPQTLSSDKAALRRLMETRRAEASAQNKNAAIALREHFLKTITCAPRAIVASYRARDGEMNPEPLAEALRAAGHSIVLPVLAGRGEALLFRLHNPGDALIRNKFGIEEPAGEAPVLEPDVLLVPLLAFDRQGGRLGAGGGYYDCTLAALRAKKRILAVGIGFSCQEVPAVPMGPHDAKLDRIATDMKVF